MEGREQKIDSTVADQKTQKNDPRASEPPIVWAPRRVLVADDEHLVATGVSASLKAVGFEVCGPAADGQSALELARSDHPDLALLDIRMPGIDGLACAEALWKELEIPAVILSAYSSSQYVEEAQRIGVFGYLLKPIASDMLRTTISVAWSKASTQLSQTRRIGQLEQTLAVRKTVEMAKWRLIEHRRMTEPEAHALLQRTARNERRRLVDLAEDILKAADHPILRAG